MKLKDKFFNFFHFNKQERNGVFILCIIIAILFSFKLLIPVLFSDHNSVQLITINVRGESNAEITEYSREEYKEKETSKILSSKELFVFNPNTITAEDAEKLGFSKKLSTTLIKFRSKGGKFYKAEDLKKLYGLSPKLYEQLEAYILIPNLKKEYVKDSSKTFVAKAYEKKTFTKQLLEINSADSLAIVFLKGIGPGFTKRILKYRAMLGGFHSVEQLRDVYGMTDSIYNCLASQIQLDKNNISKIPINAIDFTSLRKHFYFNFQSAQAIINYRNKHGRLNESDIKALGIFSEEKLQLILPYLSY